MTTWYVSGSEKLIEVMPHFLLLGRSPRTGKRITMAVLLHWNVQLGSVVSWHPRGGPFGVWAHQGCGMHCGMRWNGVYPRTNNRIKKRNGAIRQGQPQESVRRSSSASWYFGSANDLISTLAQSEPSHRLRIGLIRPLRCSQLSTAQSVFGPVRGGLWSVWSVSKQLASPCERLLHKQQQTRQQRKMFLPFLRLDRAWSVHITIQLDQQINVEWNQIVSQSHQFVFQPGYKPH